MSMLPIASGALWISLSSSMGGLSEEFVEKNKRPEYRTLVRCSGRLFRVNIQSWTTMELRARFVLGHFFVRTLI